MSTPTRTPPTPARPTQAATPTRSGGAAGPTGPAGPTNAAATAGTGRRIALVAGLLYLLTFVASLPQLVLFARILDDPTGYVTGTHSTTSVVTGSVLEIVTAAAGVATAVVLYPVTRRVSRTAAISLVASRVVEATMILVGVLSLLTVLTLQHRFAGATGAQAQALGVTGEALVAMRQWTFLLGPGVMAGVNDLLLGYLLLRGRLVPRIIPIVGLIGAPLILVSDAATLFGVWGQLSLLGTLFGLPVALFELAVGVWLTVKGFSAPAAAADTSVSHATPVTR